MILIETLLKKDFKWVKYARLIEGVRTVDTEMKSIANVQKSARMCEIDRRSEPYTIAVSTDWWTVKINLFYWRERFSASRKGRRQTKEQAETKNEKHTVQSAV